MSVCCLKLYWQSELDYFLSVVSSLHHMLQILKKDLIQDWDHKQEITDNPSAQCKRPSDDLPLIISTQIRTEPRVLKSINGSDILELMGCWKLPRSMIGFIEASEQLLLP